MKGAGIESLSICIAVAINSFGAVDPPGDISLTSLIRKFSV